MNKSIENFLANNKDIRKKEETDHVNFENLWGDDTFICRFEKKTTDFGSLDNIELPNEFSAIFHKDQNCLEFIYAVIKKTDKTIGRKFKFYFEGLEFEAYFDKPSVSLNLLASGFRVTGVPSETNYRNLRMFYD